MTLRHSVVGPGWVTLLGQNITRGFLVYELVEGGSLVSKGGTPSEPYVRPLQQRVQFISSTTTLVERMHSKGYIHRDIQLGNVLVDRRGSPVLADPSLVSMDNGTGGRSDKVVVRTRQYWMAPESSSMFVCAATDVYGLGFLFIGLLLGNSSF